MSRLVDVTQIPTKADDEILLEAATDGFLIDLPALTTESPKRNTTLPAVQSSSTVAGESDFEGSASGESSDLFPQYATTTQSVTHTQFLTSTVFLRGVDHSSSDSSAIQSTQSSLTSTPLPKETQSSTTTDHPTASQTTHHAGSTFALLDSGSGSGDGLIPDEYPTKTASTTSTTSPVTKTSTENSVTISSSTTTKAAPLGQGRGRISNGKSAKNTGEDSEIRNATSVVSQPINNVSDSAPKTSETHKGHSTPDWIIIVGFIVGVAALIMLLAAIATRDKWNRPKTAHLEDKTNSANQQKEQEMETFLRNDQPKENGKASEYTVIPLDELPDKYSSD
ncbi:A-agglutinin anchorage subunit-like [Xyrichtys novacula]|uniref:A-agglutinin anchorage subunit-like n=1 Tax=Xyrichtys novacula TaxID=13765 RepID=A0AAV1EKI0_XYRNO|nr:A-agglutinin anchorage subunit-like [Xyrichtys novacula]